MAAKNRIQYYDALKFIAILSIIALHIVQIWDHGEQVLHFDFYAIIELFKIGVPLFLMITGALLLNREIELKSFFKKKFVRIFYPLIFFFILNLIIMRPHSPNFFRYNWYAWFMIGVYLAIPIINKFVYYSSLDEIRQVVIIIFISSIIYQLFNYSGDYFYLNLNFFLGPFCYLIMGYYFSRKEYDMSPNKIITICLILFISATLLKMCGQLKFIPIDLVINFNANMNDLVFSWIDVGPLELIQASSIFVLFRYLYESKTSIYSKFRNLLETKYIKKFIISVSKASYGMYLVNVTFMSLCKTRVSHMSLTGTQMTIWFLMLTISIFLGSWLVVVAFGKIPFIKRFSGYA